MITTADGVSLEAVWSAAVGDPVGCAVLCHPHPLDGGTMNAPLMRTVAATLADAGLRVLRFNFRGVGASTGSWGGGVGEIEDVAAAVAYAAATHPGWPIGVAGWSFGAATSLAWQVRTGSILPWVGIAPGIHPYRGSTPPDPGTLRPAPRLVILGDRDQFATVEEMRTFTDRGGMALTVLPGSDHFFFHRERRVGDLVAGHFGGRNAPGPV